MWEFLFRVDGRGRVGSGKMVRVIHDGGDGESGQRENGHI